MSRQVTPAHPSDQDAALPAITIILVNYLGAEHTITCLNELHQTLDYPRFDVVCVDNSPGKDDYQRIAAAVKKLPDLKVTLVSAGKNLGFATGCNLGATHASGTVLAFLNNDARPDARWARAAVSTLRADPTVAAVASKVLDWSGDKADFIDAGLTWFGMGYKRRAGESLAHIPAHEHDTAKDVLFATGAAMFIRASVFAELGGFDERFFMFYEDVDLGWRLNLRGWRVRYVPESIAYHHHHGTVSTVDSEMSGRETFLLERNALAALYKNLSDETLATVLPSALALTVRRATARTELDVAELDPTSTTSTAETGDISMPRPAIAGVFAIDQFVDLLPQLVEARKIEQGARVRSDRDLLPLLRKALEPAYPLPRYLAAHEILVEAFGIDEIFHRRRKVLVLTGDAVGQQMAGPAIRAWHIAETLSAEHEVRLVTVNPAGVTDPASTSFTVESMKPRELSAAVSWADIVVLQGHMLEMASSLKTEHANTIVVCDLYDPMHLEVLEQDKTSPDDQRTANLTGVTKVLDTQLARGDFFLCASERQRLFWLGHLTAIGRLSPRLYDADPTTQSLLAVVPFGLPEQKAVKTGPGLRATLGLADTDHVALWGGGIYNWFDPITLIHAVDELRHRRNDVRLVFLGVQHPNPEVSEMDIVTQARRLADTLGLTNKHVFFNERWVPYAERHNWFLDADCGVTTHHEHMETTLAFRTRVLDYLWAQLPIVTTNGDTFADLVTQEKLGVAVPAENTHLLAEALEKALYDQEFAEECRRRLATVNKQFTWPVVLKPLMDFCRDPRPAADRLVGAADLTESASLSAKEKIRSDVALIREYLALGGPRELVKRVSGRVRKIIRQGRQHD